MPGKAYGQQRQMEDPSMIGTLEAQARIIWPHEYRVLDGLGIAQCEQLADLGCGTGQFASRVASTWPNTKVIGLDLYDGHLAVARQSFSREEHPNLSFVQGDARQSPWQGGTFDAVSIRHVLHALPDRYAVLQEARRILKPRGLCYVLAEDYQGLLFDAIDEGAGRLFYDAHPGLREVGTDLFHGRTAYREMRAMGFEDVRVSPIVADTSNTDRETLARMLRFWRDGYSELISEQLGVRTEEIVRRFDALILSILDSERYACWLLFAISGRRPDFE